MYKKYFQQCDLTQCSVFKHACAESIAQLKEHLICNTYKKGEIVFQEGNVGDNIFCLKEGQVRIYGTGKDGNEQIFRFAKGGGDVFGGNPFNRTKKKESYDASAVALEDSKICVIPRDALLEVYEKDFGLAKHLTQLLYTMFRLGRKTIMLFAHDTARVRLAKAIFILKKRYGTRPDGPYETLNVTLSRDEFASLIGASREATTRLLSDLIKEGVITSDDHRKITIVNEDRLRKIAKDT